MRPIEELSVYNPKEKGIDWNILKHISEINLVASHLLGISLGREVLQSPVTDYTTLENYLLLPALPGRPNSGGYFARNPDVFAVLFVDGKFHSKYSRKEYPVDLEKIAEVNGSIPVLITVEERSERVKMPF